MAAPVDQDAPANPEPAPRAPSAPDERVLATMNVDGSRRWIRPKLSSGRFLTRRQIVGWVLIATFVVIPYLKMNGKPLILLDILHRRFVLFGSTFLATDTFLLMLLLLTLLIGIFLLTALLGRVWCGWACPQTVYMELLFRPLERWIEGGRARQLRLDRTGPDVRRFLKYPIFGVISLFLAHIFLSYFVGVDQLFTWVRGSPVQHPVAFLVMAGVTLAMFFDFAYFREQTCLVACPYGRFQSVLLDRHSVIVGYDEKRGEPRGRGKRKDPAHDARGDCVDCRLCVTTCPTGIDIRDGLQMECIGCTQCIDACDAVMDKVGRPRGLIGYSSQDELAGKPRRIVRPRVLVYLGIFTVLATLLVTQILDQESAEVSVVRAPGAPFSELPDGTITNTVRIRVSNRTDSEHHYTLQVSSPSGVMLKTGTNPVTVAAGETETVYAFVVAPRELFQGRNRHSISLRVADELDFWKEIPYLLFGPAPPAGESPRKGTSR